MTTQFDDGREEDLVSFVLAKPGLQHQPLKVLDAIDEYGRKQKYLMNVGEDKGRIVTNLIREVKPKVMVELGGYCGYSTILFANVLKEVGGEKFFSLEKSPKFGKNINALVRLAGLDDFVEVVVGSSTESIQRLYDNGEMKEINMMFLDHYKPLYTTDLKLCESLGLIKKGTLLAADNVIKPGNPRYLRYVRSKPEEKRMALKAGDSKLNASKEFEKFSVTHAALYGSEEIPSNETEGNPNLVYRSDIIHSFEPTGIPVSHLLKHCIIHFYCILTTCRMVSKSLTAWAKNRAQIKHKQIPVQHLMSPTQDL
jgi:catechol O-methyltransferase